MFSGIDPHVLLYNVAAEKKMSVFFGIPASPKKPDGSINGTLMPAYYNFVNRVLMDHRVRYKSSSNILNLVLIGYYCTDEQLLAFLLVPLPFGVYPYLKLYSNLAHIVKGFDKKFALSPYLDLRITPENWTAEAHVVGFEALATSGADIVAVQEGRGVGNGAYFWETQINDKIGQVDPKLLKILQYKDPSVKNDVTFKQMYSTSINQVRINTDTSPYRSHADILSTQHGLTIKLCQCIIFLLDLNGISCHKFFFFMNLFDSCSNYLNNPEINWYQREPILISG